MRLVTEHTVQTVHISIRYGTGINFHLYAVCHTDLLFFVIHFLTNVIVVACSLIIWKNGGEKYFRPKRVCDDRCWRSSSCTYHRHLSYSGLYRAFCKMLSGKSDLRHLTSTLNISTTRYSLLWPRYDQKIQTHSSKALDHHRGLWDPPVVSPSLWVFK